MLGSQPTLIVEYDFPIRPAARFDNATGNHTIKVSTSQLTKSIATFNSFNCTDITFSSALISMWNQGVAHVRLSARQSDVPGPSPDLKSRNK